ncbi:hypothetical protein C4573_01005 [Candidatus Woesearchaeota archaeon]|nr:MAG: hypothetical protein C4573_01005 [Candidatus Woesearchaeota archaeon]
MQDINKLVKNFPQRRPSPFLFFISVILLIAFYLFQISCFGNYLYGGIFAVAVLFLLWMLRGTSLKAKFFYLLINIILLALIYTTLRTAC